MPTIIKMRCSRVAQYDQAGQNLSEITMASTDRDGQPLNDPAHVMYGNLTATFVRPDGDELEHDSVVDVTLTPAVAADAASRRGDSKTEEKKQ